MIEQVSSILGEARNYGPTPEEQEELERIAAEERLRKETEERNIKQRKEAEEAAIMKQKQEEWVSVA